MNEKLTISRLAKAAGVGVETVRYYQRRGLLETPSPNRSIRHYGAPHLERLQFIKRAQGLGFTLEEVAELLTLNDSRDHRVARRLAQEKIRDIDDRIARLGKMAEALRHLAQKCERGGAAMPCPIIRMTLS